MVRDSDHRRIGFPLKELCHAFDPVRCLCRIVHPVDIYVINAEQFQLHLPHICNRRVRRWIHALRRKLVRNEVRAAWAILEERAEHLLRCTDPVRICRVPEVQPMGHGTVEDGAQLLLRIDCAEHVIVAPCPCAECDFWQICHSNSSHFRRSYSCSQDTLGSAVSVKKFVNGCLSPFRKSISCLVYDVK